MLFPDPATVTNCRQRLKKEYGELRTLAMYEQKSAHQIPLVEGVPSGKPDCRFTVADSARAKM